MKYIQIKTFIFSALILGLTSCLKEGKMNIDTTKGPKNVVEFSNTGDDVSASSSTYPRFNTDLGSLAAGASATFNVNVSYSGGDVAPSDINVTLALDAASLVLFNTQNGTDYKVPPTDVFSFPTSVVIKKGTRLAQIKLSVKNTNDFDFNVNYAIPITIASTSMGTLSSNFGKAFYSFSVRNSYDGIYTMDATAPMVDATSTSLTGFYPLDMYLITYTGNSVALYDGEGHYSKGYYHPILSGGTNISGYGAFSPIFYFNSTGKVTSVGNYYGQNAGGNKRSAMIDPTGVNQATFNSDGSMKSFEVSYIMTQSVASPDLPRTYFHEKFTHKGAR